MTWYKGISEFSSLLVFVQPRIRLWFYRISDCQASATQLQCQTDHSAEGERQNLPVVSCVCMHWPPKAPRVHPEDGQCRAVGWVNIEPILSQRMLAGPTKRLYKICKVDISYLQNYILNLVSGKFYFISKWKCFPNSIHYTLYYVAASSQETIYYIFIVHKSSTPIIQIAFCTLQKHCFILRFYDTWLCKGKWCNIIT